MSNEESDVRLDENLYSRQLYVLGHEAMQKMMKTKVLVIGLDGLGQEIAKNLCLAGLKSIDLFDKTLVTARDLGAGFYLSRSSIAHSRDTAVWPQLRALNKYVSVHVAAKADPTAYDIVVSVNQPLEYNIKIGNICHENKIKFILANVSGLFSQVFADMGEHLCIDKNGEPPSTGGINDITDDGVVTIADGSRHNLVAGDTVRIGKAAYKVRPMSRTQFVLEGYAPGDDGPQMGGDFEQVKEPFTISFRSLAETLEQPSDAEIVAFGEAELASFMHSLFVGVCNDKVEQGSVKGVDNLGGADNLNDVNELDSRDRQNSMDSLNRQNSMDRQNSTEQSNTEQSNTEPNNTEQNNISIKQMNTLVSQFKATRGCLIAPMCSIVGGFAAQEVLKASSGKFTPLKQFFYFSCHDAYRGDGMPPSQATKTGPARENTEESSVTVHMSPCINAVEQPTENRFYDMQALFGARGFEDLAALRVFLVGAGAIGCENIKNLVMSGIGMAGAVHVTDMDSIEQSNLNRQFLFREEDVSEMKSEAAVRQAHCLNEDYKECLKAMKGSSETDDSAAKNLVAYSLAVGTATESTFSDRFLEGMDIVLNALDNVEARSYMDGRCIQLRKPMIDAGTLGTKGHVQVILPFFTESYGSTVDAAETNVPMCTIKSYPSTIEHTIEWALGEFRRKFSEEIEMIQEHVDNGTVDDEDIAEIIEEAPRNVEGCIKAALALFVNLFSTTIQNLLSTFPADYITKEGLPFWVPPKRPPTPISFNINDKLHILFVESCANLFAACFGIRKITRNEVFLYLENVLSLCEPNPITFGDQAVDLHSLTPIEYEKDSWHADFIYACANLRARNYKIKEQTKHFVRGISGKIIPAIATTTAVVSGLSIMELIKYVLSKQSDGRDYGTNCHGTPNTLTNSNCSTINDISSLYESCPDTSLIKETDENGASPAQNPPTNKNAFLDLAMPFLALVDYVSPKKLEYEARDRKIAYDLWSRIELPDSSLREIMGQLEKHLGKEITMVSLGSKIIYWNFNDKYAENLEKLISELCNKTDGQRIQYIDTLTEDETEMESVAVVFAD